MTTLNVQRLHLLIGADYSQQEPKITADLSDDTKFIEDCASGKDVYATIASIAFKQPYEECLEFRPDGSVNKEGKERRSKAKVILLGICYGKTMKSIAEGLNKTEEEAKEIYEAVLTNISGLRNFMEYSQSFCKQYGYVETKWGRRRYIPDMQLEPYEIKSKGNKNFDPFFDSQELGVIDDTERKKQQILQDLLRARYKQQKEKIKLNAEKEGFEIKENTKKIEDATRQCVNCVDKETEILTKDGWKTVYDLTMNDIVYTYNLESGIGQWDNLLAINKYEGDFNVYKINHPTFNTICTEEHKWIQSENKPNSKHVLKTIEQLNNNEDNDETFSILTSNAIDSVEGNYEDWFLKLIGWFLTKGSIEQYNDISIDVNRNTYLEKCQIIENILKEGNIIHSVNDKHAYNNWNICIDIILKLETMFPDKVLTPQFIQSLSARQAKLIIDNILLSNKGYIKTNDIVICDSKQKADMFEMLCALAGISCTYEEIDNIEKEITSPKLDNDIAKNKYYKVRLLKTNKININKNHISMDKINFVWCPTTNNGTWFARRNGQTYFTGNSRIQGSAADQTKIAMRLIGNNETLKKLNFKMVLLVHDEIIGECPFATAHEAIPIFKQCMLDAAKDLRSGSKCDETSALKWYGEDFQYEDINNTTLLNLMEQMN